MLVLTVAPDMQGDNQLLFLSTLGVWALGAACLGPTIPAYANDVIPAAHRGVGVALFRSCGDLGFMTAPVLVGALVDATSLQIGAQGMALGVCGSAAVYALGAVPSKRLSVSSAACPEGVGKREIDV